MDASGSRRVVPTLLLLAAVSLTFAPSLRGGFVWDDVWLVQHDPDIRDLRSLPRIFARSFFDVPSMTRGELEERANIQYRPLVTLSFMVDHQIFGDGPFGFHLTNLLLHLVITLMVFWLARGVVGAGAGLAVALLCAVHPSRAEAVSWISGRTELLMSLFVLAGLAAFVRCLRSTGRRLSWLGLGWLLFVGALLCKESAVVLAPLVPLADWLLVHPGQPWRARRKRLLWCHAPLLLAAVAFAAARYAWQRGHLLEAGPTGLAAHVTDMLQTLGHYATLLVAPYWPSAQIGAFRAAVDWTMVGVGIASLVVVAGGVYLTARRRAWTSLFAILGGVVALAPVANIVPLRLSVLAAERFLYLPLMGPALLVGLWLRRLEGRPPRGPGAARRGRLALLAAVALVCASWSVTTFRRGGDFRDSLRFWSAEHAADPANPLAAQFLGEELLARSRPAEAEGLFLIALRGYAADGARYFGGSAVNAILRVAGIRLARIPVHEVSPRRRVLSFVERLVQLSRGRRPARIVLRFEDGQPLVVDGEYPWVRQALARAGPALLAFLGVERSLLGEDVEAVQTLREAVAAAPRRTDLQLALATALARSGQLDEAARVVQAVRAGDPRTPRLEAVESSLRRVATIWRRLPGSGAARHLELAEAQRLLGAPLRAARELRTVLEIEPGNLSARGALALQLSAGGSLAEARRLLEGGSWSVVERRGLEARARAAYRRWQLSVSGG